MRNIVIALCAAAVVMSGGCRKTPDVKVLKLAHGLDINHPVHKAMEFMAERVRAKSGGRLVIDIYPGEQLGSERECIELLQMGSLSMTKVSSSLMEGFVPLMKVLSMPYLFRGSDHYWRVLSGPVGKEILSAGEAGPVYLKGLCFYDAGARSFYTVKKPVNAPADLKGLKIRVMKSNLAIKMIEAMGASATPIDWGELYTSLQQGVVDGAENNPPSFYNSRHYEICKYYSLDEHTRPPDMLFINSKVWHGLSPQFQQILQESADESVVYQRQLWIQREKEALEKIVNSGVTIIRPDKQLFFDAIRPMYDELKGGEAGALADKIRNVQ